MIVLALVPVFVLVVVRRGRRGRGSRDRRARCSRVRGGGRGLCPSGRRHCLGRLGPCRGGGS